MAEFKRGDMVRHKDGRSGMVERVTGSKVSIHFEYHWRTSVVDAKSIFPIEQDDLREQP